MAPKKPISLRTAIERGELDTFIRQHEKGGRGDFEKLDQALKQPVSQKTKEAPKASSRKKSGD